METQAQGSEMLSNLFVSTLLYEINISCHQHASCSECQYQYLGLSERHEEGVIAQR